MLGNGRLEAMCFDGVKRLCHIRDKLRKKVWINQSDIVLIGLRDYQVCEIDCLHAAVWNQTVLTVVVHRLKSLIPGRKG